MRNLRGRRGLIGTVGGMALILAMVSGVLLTSRGAPATRGRVTYSLQATATTGAASSSTTTGSTTTIATPTPSSGPGQGGHRGCPYADTCNGGSGGNATPTVSPGGPGATPTATPTTGGGGQPTATPTATIGSTGGDGAALVGPTTPQTVGGAAPNLPMTVVNTGTTTWTSAGGTAGYIFKVIGACPTGASGYLLPWDVAPGQQMTFSMQLTGYFNPWLTTPFTCRFQMQHDLVGFGSVIVMDGTVTGESPLFTQAVPSCGNPSGVSWSWVNSGGGNSIACTGSGLEMQQGMGAAPQALLTSAPGSFYPTNYHMHVHVHFPTTDPATLAGFALRTASPDGCGGSRLLVSAGGTYEVIDYLKYSGQTTCSVATDVKGQMSPSSDYDLAIVVQSGGATTYMYVDGGEVFDGGTGDPYPPEGLTVFAASGSSAPVYFSQFEVDQPAAATVTYSLHT